MLRRLGVLLAGAILAAACGDDDRRAGSGRPITTAPDETTTLSAVAPAEPAAGVGAPSQVPPAGGPDPTAAPGGSTAPVVPVGPAGPAPGPPSGGTIGTQAVGRLAPFLLRPGHGDRIVVEVRAQAGAEPRRATIDHLVGVLREASAKTVLVDGADGVAGGGQAWTAASLSALADASAELPQGGDQVVLRLLFLRGTFEGDAGVLGVAVRGDVAAIFSDRVDAAAGPLVDPATVEDAVTLHEVGHLLGLVDLIVGSGRGDPEHPGHSRNRRSVMFWAVESDAISQLLGGGIPNQLDADDRAELAAIRRG